MRVTGRGLSGGLPGGGRRGRSTTRGRSSRPLDRDSHAGLETGLIPGTIPEMPRMLRGTVNSPPRRDRAHR